MAGSMFVLSVSALTLITLSITSAFLCTQSTTTFYRNLRPAIAPVRGLSLRMTVEGEGIAELKRKLEQALEGQRQALEGQRQALEGQRQALEGQRQEAARREQAEKIQVQADAQLKDMQSPFTRYLRTADYSLAEVQDLSDRNKNEFTVSVSSIKLMEIRPWPLRQEVIEYRESTSQFVLNSFVPKIDTMAQEAYSEKPIHVAFLHTVGNALKGLTNASGSPVEVGEPKKFQSPSNADVMICSCSASRRILMVGECKRRNFCDGVDESDLISRFLSKKSIVDCGLEQIGGYMYECNVRFGFLTTYNWLWLVRLDSNAELNPVMYVSEGFSAKTIGSDSLLNALLYGLHLAQESTLEEWQKPTCGPGYSKTLDAGEYETKKRSRKTKAKGKSDDNVARLFDDTKLVIVKEFADHHRDRVCFGVKVEGDDKDRVFFLKCFLDEEQRDHEASLYDELRDLHGNGIPRLLRRSLKVHHNDNPGDERHHALVLEWCGKSAGVGASKESARRLKDILYKMHSLGVVHGDVAERNVIMSSEGEGVFLLDLGEGKTKEELGEDEFGRQCSLDLRMLEEMTAELLATGPPGR